MSWHIIPCVQDIALPFFRRWGNKPFATEDIARTLGMDLPRIRSRCMAKLREQGLIHNKDPKRVRCSSRGYGQTRYIFTGKFLKWAEMKDDER